MLSIAGINVPTQKHAVIALTAIYGIGLTRARDICVAAKVEPSKKIRDLSDAEVDRSRRHITRRYATPSPYGPRVS